MGSLRPILHSRLPSSSCKRTILLSVDLCLFCSSMHYISLQFVGGQGWDSAPVFLSQSLDCKASCFGCSLGVPLERGYNSCHALHALLPNLTRCLHARQKGTQQPE